MAFDFTGRSVLVTGAGTGIGAAAAILLGSYGAGVGVAGRAGDPLAQVVKTIRDAGGTAIEIEMDVTDSAQVDSAVARMVEEFGALHHAVNSAGVKEIMRPFVTVTDEEWASVIRVNLDGVFYSLRAEIPAILAAGGGSIVNITSTQATQPLPTGAPYTATKWGALGLTKAAALQYAAQGVRVTGVSPGVTNTPMVQSEPAAAGAMADRTPMQRMAEPVEMAHACAFLLSDEASYITGTDIVVDGGQLLV